MGTVSQRVECVLKNQAAVRSRHSDDRDATRGFDVASVRQTTVSRSAPCPFHPVAADIHCFRPEMTHESPNRRAVCADAFSWR